MCVVFVFVFVLFCHKHLVLPTGNTADTNRKQNCELPPSALQPHSRENQKYSRNSNTRKQMPACTQERSHFPETASRLPGSIMAPPQEAEIKCRLASNSTVREPRPLTQKEKGSHPSVFSKGILLEAIPTPGSFVLRGGNRQWSKRCNLFSSHKEKVTTTLLFILRL